MRWTVALSFYSFFSGLKVQASSVQKDGLTLPDSVTNYRDAVKDIFQTSYTAYKTYAWGHDDLTPESKSYYDGRNGWGASIVDAMSTMYVMGLDDLLDEAVTYAGTIDFSSSKTSDHVSVFETTIRYLGSLLSVYELRGCKDEVLLEKAVEVADKMAHAWVGDNDIPYGHIDFSSNQPDIATSNIAEAGTLIIEWAALSKYTGNDTYRELADKAMRHIANLGAPLPGLAAQGIDPSSGEFVGGYVTWGGGSDSYFEYLLKYPRLANLNDTLYVDTWLTAVDSSIKYLLRRSTVGQHLYTCDYDAASSEYENVGSHLACFHAGNWLYGGTLLGNDTIVNTALELLEGCWNTYASTATGIGPEAFAYITPGGNTSSLSPDQQSFYDKHGFYITSSYYILRPEVLESNFYAWRITGDTKYLDRAASAVDSFKNYLSAAVAYDGIYDVDSTSSSKVDDMESFWFAEVLKYLYLTFDDPTNISIDDYVFNTEAHPFKAPVAQPTYDSGSLTINTTSVFKTVSGTLPAVSPNVHISGVEV
ncbi:related to Mannosyl-oligosaccharide alpha-1,2-mannosidase precursor [Armillaria ostoyae]|uniref:alpha-1,2-Mannosidase n=1 Tax=Armillaria ostoyae TaxID=47428 RepID=A0A284R5B6_ARMOS|nr:related to Mannosyl-oligosaccharide alpha-1,2-mannosidase precursor [Armillaria ostoyae]